MSTGAREGERVDVVVLTVIPAELSAARLALGGDLARAKAGDGTVELHGAVRNELTGRDYRVVLACIGGAGNPGAAVMASGLIARHHPRAFFLMGIAAGVRGKIRIGDVVFSDRVVAYEPAALVRAGGASVEQPRPEIDRAPSGMVQDVVNYRSDRERLRAAFAQAGGEIPAAPPGREEEFREHVASSVAARLATIASGEKLLRDPAKLRDLRESVHGKIEVGEMEAAGLVEACRPRNVPWMVVRGISDFGDEIKDDRFHAFAARAAAAVLVDFLRWGLELGGAVPPMPAPVRQVSDSPGPLPGYEMWAPPPPPPPNPFIFGRPVDRDEDFVGRAQEKRWILEAIDKGEPVQLLGESRMGKSSLLRWVQRNVLPGRPVVEVDPMCDLTPASMVLAIARKLGKGEAAAGLARAEATSGEAAAVLEALVPLVLVMDDADALADRGKGFDAGFFAALRGLVQARRLTWVSASRRNLYDLFDEKGLSSAFLNDAQKFWVGPLEAEAARALAGRGAAAEVERVLLETGRMAYGVQWVGDYLYRRPRAVDHACDAFADEAEAIFGRWWRGLSVEERQLLKRCLDGGVKAEGVERGTRRKLRGLVGRGLLVEREDGGFVVEGVAWREFVGSGG